MIKKVSKTNSLFAQLKKEGKVTPLNEEKHDQAIEEMNKELEESRRAYKVKDRESQTSAANVILNV